MTAPWMQKIEGAGAVLLDPEGFDMKRYCGVYVVPGDEAAIVETAASPTADRVLAGLDAAGVARESVKHVFVTHVHMDHAGAAWRLLQELPNARLVVHEKGAPYLTDPGKVQKLLQSVERAVGPRFPLYGTLEPIDPARVDAVTGGESFTVAGRRFEVVDAPGHAPHHYVLHDKDARVVYTGDAVGMRPPESPHLVTTPPPRFDLDTWHDTLDRIAALDADRALLTHFGVAPLAEHIDVYRKILDAWVEDVTKCRDEGVSEADAVRRLMDVHTSGRRVYDEETFEEEVQMNVRGVWLWLERGT